MTKKIVIAGGTGFVGKYLSEQFSKSGYEIIIISRQKNNVSWHNRYAIVEALNNSEMVINLAGKSVNCRHTAKNKAEILNSRLQTTKTIGEAILQCTHPPPLWINASAASIYGNAEYHPVTEKTGTLGSNFSAEVAIKWEKAFFDFNLPDTRQVALRISIILGKNGGVMKPYINLVRFWLGGTQGDGKQFFSWVHIDDMYTIILFLQKNKQLQGAFNCASPYVINNKTLMKTLRQTMNVKIGLPAPKLAIRIGALIMNTEADLILNSSNVLPEKLLNAGYVFKYSTINSALQNIVSQEK